MPLRARILPAILVVCTAACQPANDPADTSVFAVPFGTDSVAIDRIMAERGLRPVRVSNTGTGRYMLFTGSAYRGLVGNDTTRSDSTAHVVVAMSDSGRLAGLAVSADFVDSASAIDAFTRLANEAVSRFGEPDESTPSRLHWELGDTLSVNVAVRQRSAQDRATHVVAFTITQTGMVGRTDAIRQNGINEGRH